MAKNKSKGLIPFAQKVKEIVDAKPKEAVFATWYSAKGQKTSEYTYERLWEESGSIAHYLLNKWKVKKGDRVILCYDFGLDFFATFLACLRAGVVAVLVYPPGRPLVQSLKKLKNVVDDCDPVLVLTNAKVNLLRMTDYANPFSKSRQLWPQIPYQVTTDCKRIELQQTLKEPGPFDLAFLQYTSGSTGNPKGVMVTHGALAANVKLIGEGYQLCFSNNKPINEDDQITGFSWLPQYHDLGLIVMSLAPLAYGFRMHYMSPITFIQNPLLWVDLMSRHKVHFSAAPDFAYRLVCRKFKQAQMKESGPPILNLNLAHIHHLQSSAEPIRQDTVREFTDVFRDFGLPENWFMAAYGLAETVVCVCWLHEFKTNQTSTTDEQSSTSTDDEHQPEFVAVGHHKNFHPSLDVKIVHSDTYQEVTQDGITGEIWVAGPSVAAGYYGKPELSHEVFGATIDHERTPLTYLRTGDLGFFRKGYLHVCGRIKDIVIVNGVNYYPQDIEAAVQDASNAVRPGCVAAFSSDDSGNDGELEIVFEIRKENAKEVATVCSQVQTAVSQNIGLLARVVAIQERTICKTTSGKIQRRKNRSTLHDGQHQILHDLSNPSSGPTILDSTLFHDDHDNFGNDNNKNKNNKKDTNNDQNNDQVAIPHLSLELFLTSLFGDNIDESTTWDDLGMTSIQSVELANFVAEHENVQLGPDYMDQFPTPALLKQHIAQTRGSPINVALPKLPKLSKGSISWTSMGILQLFCMVALLLLFTLPVLPALYVSNHAEWYFIPFVLPIWMIGYTIIVIFLKWIVIGVYREQEVKVPSTYYIRWWMVDRAVHFWELFVGWYIRDSPLFWLVYTLMGAKIDPSASMDSMIREFDLISIGENTNLSYPLRGCQFNKRDNNKNKNKYRQAGHNGNNNIIVLQFRSIDVGGHCTVDGHLSPGVRLGEGVRIEKSSVVAEGGQVPSNALVKGNPAYHVGSDMTPFTQEPWLLLGLLKILWYIVELYLSCACIGVSRYVIWKYLHRPWSYGSLVLGFYSVLLGFLISVAISIGLKWILIGKRAPGKYQDTLQRRYADWVADYHFQLSAVVLRFVSSNSLTWNVVMMMYGLDIDFRSKIIIDNYPPSKVDLIKIQKSFLSSVSFDTKSDGKYRKTKVLESSVGWLVNIGPGVKISRSILYPFTNPQVDVIQKELDRRAEEMSLCRFILDWILIDVFYLLVIGMMVVSCIPVYELCQLFLPMLSPALKVLFASLLIVIQTMMFVVVLYVVQFCTYLGSNKKPQAWNNPLLAVTLTLSWLVQMYTFVPLLWGTPMMVWVARLLGVKVEGSGRVLMWGELYDFPYLSIGDNTVIDNSHVSGHHAVYGDITLGESRVNGILHVGTFIMANVNTWKETSGPWGAPVCNEIMDWSAAENNMDSSSSIVKGEKERTGTVLGDDIESFGEEFDSALPV